ncbi:MAG: amidase [Acidimicrobiia bacterium]|nr:amidase [Acidimicrobiia bacterium]
MTDSPELGSLDATAQAALVTNGDATATELVEAAIARVEQVNPELNAVIHPLYERARTHAAGSLSGPFAGVPMVVKDLDGELAGAPLHLGNTLLKSIGYTATVNSYLFDKLEQAGFVIIGKTNTPEFGLQVTTEPHAYGATHNPWDLTRSTGGSSGGSAAAVASGMVPVGHAGDGGGSIRVPSSECGLVGLKPSRGRVSVGPQDGEVWNGLVARHVVTRTVRDSAAILDMVAGPMPGDPYSAPPPSRPFLTEVGADVGPLRIGLRTAAPGGLCEVDAEVVAATEATARALESLGHVVEIAAPDALDDADLITAFLSVVAANGLGLVTDLEQMAGRPVTAADVEPGTWALAEAGREVSALQYLQTIHTAHAWTRRMLEWWHSGYDLLLTPTLADLPPKLGTLNPVDGDPAMNTILQTPYAIFAAGFNVSGQPAISVPTGMSASGLPIGVQLVAAAHREDLLIAVAAQLESAMPWADRRPPIFAT